MENTVVNCRKIENTNLFLPVFGFGSAHLGEMYTLVDEKSSSATLETAWKSNIRYFDTAAWYGRGLAEHRQGSFLKTKPRKEFKITTKVGRTLFRPDDIKKFRRDPWLGGLNFEVKFDYSYDGVMRSYEQALQRLALDTVDALIIHDLDPLFHGPEKQKEHESDVMTSGIRALEELKSNGDIKAFGMGINQKESLSVIAQSLPIDFALVAMPYTLIDQDSLHDGMAKCQKNKTSVVIGAPFASGILATGAGQNSKYAYLKAPADLKRKVRKIEDVCKSHNVSLKAAALQFVLAHPAVVSTIPGAISGEQVLQNISCLEENIPASFWSDLKSQKLILVDSPTPADAK